MMRLFRLSVACALLVPAVAFSASPSPRRGWVAAVSTRLHAADEAAAAADEEEPAPTLIFGGALEDEMAAFKSKYPTSESDYLAAARQRAEEKRDSANSQSTDDDWQEMANLKKLEGLVEDDWEKSLEEAGNADSQILIPVMPDFGAGEDDEEPPEPKLLLF